MTIKKPEEKRWKELVKDSIYELSPSIVAKLKKLGLYHPDMSQGGIDSPNSVMYFSTGKHNNIPFNPQDVLKLLELVPEIKDEIVEYPFENIPSLKLDTIWLLEDDASPMLIQTKDRYFMIAHVVLAPPKKIEVKNSNEIKCPVCQADPEWFDPFCDGKDHEREHPARWNFTKGTIIKLFVCKQCQSRIRIEAKINLLIEG